MTTAKVVPIALVLLIAVFAPGRAATISGTVSVPAEAGGDAGPGAGYSRGVYRPQPENAGEEQKVEPAGADVVVWAVPEDGKAPFRPPRENPKMIQQDKTFIPHVLPVQVGATVEFPNLDPLYHNVFSYSSAKRFDLGRYEQGKSKAVTFEEPGVIDVFCEIHENMHAYILVLDTPWFTRAGDNGEYSLDLPAGRYTVYAWARNSQSEPVRVDVSGDGSEQVDFSF